MKTTFSFAFFIAFTSYLSLISITNASFTEEELIVDAGPLGKIRGVNSTSAPTSINGSGRPFIAFLGMRYAEATTGPRRFLPSIRATGPLNATGDIYDAISEGYPCVQPGIPPELVSEDCLTINVYTPKPYKGNDSELLGVLFYIHGGSFTISSGSFYNGNLLMNKDLILVNFNYRLGILGFFSMNSENSPGNAAMYDIVNALKWTKENIKYFGGDPHKITISGQSAGAVSVTHLLISPMARGLFQGAIANSGTALAAWGTTENSVQGNLIIAELSGCYNSTLPDDDITTQQIIECMQNTPHQKLVEALNTYLFLERKEARLGFDVISPVVQSFNISSSFDKFLPEHPKKVFKEGRQANVPLMMGTTRHDGSYVLGEYYNTCLKQNKLINNTEYLAQESVAQILEALGIPNEYGVYDSIAKMYLGGARKTGDFDSMFPGFIDVYTLFSVFFFKASSYKTALHQSKINNNTFWFSFDFQGRHTLWNYLFPLEPPPFRGGITHGDDLIYLFPITGAAFNEEEYAVSNRMLDYWANFVNAGNPTPEATVASDMTIWPHLTVSAERFININKDSSVQAYFDDTWSGAGLEVVQ